MENYIENHKKYNKTIFKFMGYKEDDVDFKNFAPHDPIVGFEILRWVIHKINHNPKPNRKMRVIISMKDDETEVFVQEWHDVSKPNGYVNIVHHIEKCEIKEKDADAQTYKSELLSISHKATYNACVDFIIKFS